LGKKGLLEHRNAIDNGKRIVTFFFKKPVKIAARFIIDFIEPINLPYKVNIVANYNSHVAK
jgi:hypothetical protein